MKKIILYSLFTLGVIGSTLSQESEREFPCDQNIYFNVENKQGHQEIFDGKGNLARESFYLDSYQGSNMIIFQNRFKYDKSGLLVEKQEEASDISSNVIYLRTTTFKYNRKGELKKEVSSHDMCGDGSIDEKIVSRP